MSTTALKDVTRWAALLDDLARQEGLEPASIVPLALGIISKESSGQPSARNGGSNAIGLGQQFAWYKKGHPRAGERYFGAGPEKGPFTAPWTSKDAEFMPGLPVTWNPVDQLRALIKGLNHYLKASSRAGGHLPSAWDAYAAGGGNMAKFVAGDDANHAARFAANYAPDLVERTQAYSAWYHGWAKAGRPTTTATVASGEGTSFKVTLAAAATPAEPLQSPFDGTFRWNGKTRKAGPVGPSGVSPSQVPRGTPGGGGTGNTSILLLLGTVIGGLLGFGLLRARGGA